jgi:hypothetical protein
VSVTARLALYVVVACCGFGAPAWAQDEAAEGQERPAEEQEGTPEEQEEVTDKQLDQLVATFNQALEEETSALEAEAEAAETAATESTRGLGEFFAAVEHANLGTPGVGGEGTTKDFVSTLFGALGLGTVQQEGEELVLGFNPSWLELGKLQVGIEARVREAEVYEPLRQAFEKAELAEAIDELESDLEDLDDLRISVAWAPETTRWGRDPSRFVDFFYHLQFYLTESADARETLLFQDLVRRLDERQASFAELTPQMEALGREVARTSHEVRRILDRSGFFRLGDLVSNQPQLSFTGSAIVRDDVAGPDELALDLRWEKSFVNANTLLKECGDAAITERSERFGNVAPSCFAQYVADHQRLLDLSPRVALSFEWAETDDFDYSDQVSLRLLSESKLTVKASGSVNLAPVSQGTRKPRFELELKYEDVSDQEVRNDERWIGSLAYSQKVNANATGSFEVVYASKPEFLGDVDQDFGAKFGVRFTMDEESSE